MRNLLFALLLGACSLSAQEKLYLLEYTVEEMVGNCGCPVEGSFTACAIQCYYGPAPVKKSDRFESAEAALEWMRDAPTGWVEDLWIDHQYARRPDKKPKFVALYRLEAVPVEVATETTTKERVVVDQEHETVYRLGGKEYRKPKPEAASGYGSAVLTVPIEWTEWTESTDPCNVGSTDPDYRCTSTGTRSLEIREGDILKYNGTNQR